MASRDSQTVILSRQAIVLVTAVGVGLLTLCYVLGVQVGKQSAALRFPQAKGTGEDLVALPASLNEQLKSFEQTGGSGPANPPPAALPPTPSAEAPQRAEPAKAEAPKPEAPPSKSPAAPERKDPSETGKWSLQLLSTPDSAEAKRMAQKARDAGFPTVTLSEKGLIKVRLSQTGPRETMDAAALKLKNRGFKPFAVRAQ